MSRRITVDAERTVSHLGEGGGVYGTPSMLKDIERLCHDTIAGCLENGQSSVGTRVELQHLASTPAGNWVEFTARVIAVDRRAVIFEVTGRDAIEEVCRCTHHRFVVDLDRVRQKVSDKVKRISELKPG